jgi:eukaryotic-like serine/threonine-protein kinase
MMAGKSFVFRFDDMEVSEREFTLVKAGKVLTVEPKAFRALLFLLHNPQKLIAKEELLSSVWGGAAVTDGSLTRCIWLLRSVLEDDIRNPRYIETVATVGYRFVCKVEVTEDASGTLGDSNDQAGEEPVQTAWKESAAKPPVDIDRGPGGETKSGTGKKERRRRLLYWLLPGAVVVACLAFAFWYLRLPQPPPHISEYVRHQVTTLPGSEGMISPRWSPDGRFIAVLSSLSSHNPRVYDFETKQWAELLVGPVDWPTWSKDSRSIYFLRSFKEHDVIRVSIQTGKFERVADLKGFQNAGWIGLWMGLDPTDAPLFLRNVGSEDIYALTLDRN